MRSDQRLVDLTLTIEDGMRGVSIETARTVEKDGWNASTYHLYSHDPEGYPTFRVQNITANGEVWTGVAQETRHHFPKLEFLEPEDYPTENISSIGFRLSYGAFDYFSGGDIYGIPPLGDPEWHDPAVAERFEAEAILMAKVQHPNVVSVLSSGRSGSAVYFTAEFVEGRSLSELLKEGALPPALAVFMLREITKGLAAAHDKHIFHRDIKPPNVIVSDTGEVKLTDFGMASLFEAHVCQASTEVKK